MAIDHSPAPSNLSTEQAAMQIDALLAEDPAYANDQPPEEKGRRESTQRPQQADEEPEVKAEESSEESEETEQPEEESEAEELDYDTVITVKSKDKEGNEIAEEVPLKDLISQRMLQSDYTRKTQELAQQRAEVQNELQKGIEQERQQYIQALETQQQLVVNLLAPEAANLDQLAEDDPAEFIRVNNRMSKINNVVQQIEAKKQKAIQEHREYLQTKVIPNEMELVKQKIPDWSDDLKPTLVETGKRFGYTNEELGSIIDHRQIHILHELNRLSNLEKGMADKKSVASKKVVEKPTVMKSGGKQKQSKGGESFSKLRKTGKMEDAAAFFMDTIPDL